MATPEENSLFQYKIPARTDVGKIKVEFESSYEPNGPFGAKSIGEVVINTPLPAISDAIYNAIGTRFYELPITPVMYSYQRMIDKDSMYNTPPCWCIYMTGLVMNYLENEIGGLENMQKRNAAKAKVLYDYLDGQDFYKNPVEKKYRSMMNVTSPAPTPTQTRRSVPRPPRQASST